MTHFITRRFPAVFNLWGFCFIKCLYAFIIVIVIIFGIAKYNSINWHKMLVNITLGAILASCYFITQLLLLCFVVALEL